jgi:phosphonate transport system ATP-binding protein
VLEILSQINREKGISVIVSLHQVEFALKYCPRVVGLRDGQLVYDGSNANLTPSLLAEIYCCRDSQPPSTPSKPGLLPLDPTGLGPTLGSKANAGAAFGGVGASDLG